MMQYKMIEIFTGEETRWHGKPLAEAVVRHVQALRIPARCLVTKATEGCYENGVVATWRFEVFSHNMPLKIVIVLPAPESEKVLSEIEAMVTDGIVTIRDLNVVSYKTSRVTVSGVTMVRDIMTHSPKRVTMSTPLDKVVRLLLSSVFTGVPVVDQEDRPVGVVSQSDLIYKAGLPMRLGLLAEAGGDGMSAVDAALARKTAGEVMTSPAISIDEDSRLTEAVDLMLDKTVKRLPVVDSLGRLTGMVSRIDIFKTIMKESPDWRTFTKQSIEVGNLRFVSDIMRRDTRTVLPETSVEEVIRIIDADDIQRISVVDNDGRFLGLISDKDLLLSFSGHREGMMDFLASKIPYTERRKKHREIFDLLQVKTAAQVMKTDIVTVQEDCTIDEALKLMTEKAFKRLPVLDAEGRFKGMISRDSVLRTGFAGGKSAPQTTEQRNAFLFTGYTEIS